MHSPSLPSFAPIGKQGPSTQQRGFTLLEVLIAVTVTAVIGIGVWQLLSGVISAKEGIDRVSNEFSRLQQAVVIVERDLAQILFRPVRDAYGEPLPAVTTRSEPWSIEFTRTGWRNPLRVARSDLQRVAYEVVDETLRRHYWQVLDRAQDAVPREQDLLSDVTGLSWRFLDHNREWQEDWPSDSQLQGLPINGGAQVPLPLAVEVVIEHRRFGRIRRLIDLGTFQPGQVALGVPGTGANPENGQDNSNTDTDADNGTEPSGTDTGASPQ
jgi:general secretion pathway protein J